ncbi:MAG: hypothetical protein ABIH49_03595 [archaeon]
MPESIDALIQETPENKLNELLVHLEKINEFRFPQIMRVGKPFMVSDGRVYSVGLSTDSPSYAPQTLNIFDVIGGEHLAQLDFEGLQQIEGIATDGNFIYVNIEGNFGLRGSDILLARYIQEGEDTFGHVELVDMPLDKFDEGYYKDITGEVVGMSRDKEIYAVVGFFKKNRIQGPTKGSLLKFLEDGRFVIPQGVTYFFSADGGKPHFGWSEYEQGPGAGYHLKDGKLEYTEFLYGDRIRYLEIEPDDNGGVRVNVNIEGPSDEDWKIIPLNMVSKDIGTLKSRMAKSLWRDSDIVHILYAETGIKKRGVIQITHPATIQTYRMSLKTI